MASTPEQERLLERLEAERAAFKLHDNVLVEADKLSRKLIWLREEIKGSEGAAQELALKLLRACMTLGLKPYEDEADAIRFTTGEGRNEQELFLFGVEQRRAFDCMIHLGSRSKHSESVVVREKVEFGSLEIDGYGPEFLSALTQYFLRATGRTLPEEHVNRMQEPHLEIVRYLN